MESTTLIRTVLRLHVGKQSRNQGAQEVLVFGTVRRGIPAEDPLFLTVNGGVDLRTGLCAPLGEEVIDFKVLDAHSVAGVHPSAQFTEVELVFAVNHFDLYKLCGGPITTHIGIQLRRENRG